MSCGKHDAPKPQHTAPQYDANSKFTIALVNINDNKPIGAVFTAKDDTTARARISGTLQQLFVTEGSEVKQGQVIGVINEARYNAEAAAGTANAQQVSAQTDAARARVAQAAVDYNRTKTLYEQGVYAKARLDQMQANIATANAELRAAQAATSAAQSQAQVAIAIRNQGKVLAPRSGKVVAVPVTQGAVIMPGDVIAEIAAGAPILKLSVPEDAAKTLKIGQLLEITNEEGAIIAGANITKILPQIINGQVELELSTTDTRHFIGERIIVNVPLGQRAAVIIPQNYLINRQGVDYVRLLQNQQALEIPVQRGAMTKSDKIPDAVEILSGLKAGDIIVAPENPAKGGK